METVKRKPPNSWNSYDHNLRGLTLMLQYTSQSTHEALGEFRQSIDLDPTFGLAYARAALCVRNRRVVLFEPLAEEEVSEGLLFAARAIELAPDDEAVMAMCAFVFATLNDEFERGGALADRAVALNPNLASAWSAKGWMNLYLGEPSLSVEAFGRAIRLHPLDPLLWPNILFGYACAGLLSGEYEDGLSWASQLLAVMPAYLLGLVIFVGNAAFAGRLSEAEDAAARIRKLYPHLRGSYLRLIFRARKP